jgi:hypothetical protein
VSYHSQSPTSVQLCFNIETEKTRGGIKITPANGKTPNAFPVISAPEFVTLAFQMDEVGTLDHSPWIAPGSKRPDPERWNLESPNFRHGVPRILQDSCNLSLESICDLRKVKEYDIRYQLGPKKYRKPQVLRTSHYDCPMSNSEDRCGVAYRARCPAIQSTYIPNHSSPACDNSASLSLPRALFLYLSTKFLSHSGEFVGSSHCLLPYSDLRDSPDGI